MGFFDRFRRDKKEETKVEQKQPLRIEYEDGTTAEVSFLGLQDDEGKSVHKASIIYIQTDGRFTSKSVLLEPIPYQDEKGNWIDGTEQYYRELAQQHDEKTKGAVHLFFNKREIEILEGWSSNYLGNLFRKEGGDYGINYDENYRIKHSQRFQDERAQKALEANERHSRMEAEFAAGVEAKRQQGIEQQLQAQTYPPEDTSGYAGRLTQEDYQKYFGNRDKSTPDVR